MNDQSQAAIVTGAGRGIGAAVAKRLASDGFGVIVNYASNEATATAVVNEIEAAGGKAIAVQADVGSPGALPRLFDAAEAAFGTVAVLVNNAGTMNFSPLADATDAQFEVQIATNLTSAFRGMREAAKRLSDGGRIINLSTSVVGLNLPGYGIYAAAKAGVEAMTRILAKELGRRGITVNAVAPGPVATDMFFNGKSDEQVQAISAMIPRGRLGKPEEIADVVALLASPSGGWISGQTLRANGGMV